MNFVSWIESPGTQVELKYCERCGGLWLRPRGESEVYCASCRTRMAGMPRPAEPSTRRPKLPCPRREDLQGQVQMEYLQAAIEREVRP